MSLTSLLFLILIVFAIKLGFVLSQSTVCELVKDCYTVLGAVVSTLCSIVVGAAGNSGTGNN